MGGDKEKINVIPLENPPEGIKLKTYYVYELAAKLNIHRHTLSVELNRKTLFPTIQKFGYFKGRKKLTKKMVKIILQYLGESFF